MAKQFKVGRFGLSDPYVGLVWDNQKYAKTQIIKKTLAPKWNETFRIPMSRKEMETAFLELKVKDWNRTSRNEFMGSVKLNFSKYPTQQTHESWFDLKGRDGITENPKVKGSILVSFKIEEDKETTALTLDF